MGWRNIQQQESWIPQSYVSDPDAFITAINNASDKDAVLQQYVTDYRGTSVSNYQFNVTICGDPNAQYKIYGRETGTATLYQVDDCASQASYGQQFWLSVQQEISYIALVDDTEQKGFFCLVRKVNGELESEGGTQPPYDTRLASRFYTILTDNPYIAVHAGKGGGATHIAKRTGTLAAIGAPNISDILLVSGGGGGGLVHSSTAYDGKDAGGISGSGDNSANQSTGYGFGQGESGSNVPGGGGGLYGGYKGAAG